MYNYPNYLGYQNSYYNQMQPQNNIPQPNMPQNPPQDEKLYVASKAAAEAYYVVPNGFVRLWDSNRNAFYEKRADPNGRVLPMQTFLFYPEEEQKPETKTSPEKEYVTREEFNNLSKQFSDLSNRFNGYQRKANQNEKPKEGKQS